MKKFCHKILIFLIFLSFSFSNAEAKEPKGSDFYVLTIPKSGTHLLIKLLVMLTNKSYTTHHPGLGAFNFNGDIPTHPCNLNELENIMFFNKTNNIFNVAHFNMGPCYKAFSKLHPEYVKILQIRDLRDACVSCVRFQNAAIEQEIGPSSFSQKLLYVIKLNNQNRPKNDIINMYRYASEAVKWLNKADVVCRFEELVGPEGGGEATMQRKQIQKIAKSLNIFLDKKSLNSIALDLFGRDNGPLLPTTFEKGLIGSWKKHFKEKHIKAFVENLGDLQLKLGYSLN